VRATCGKVVGGKVGDGSAVRRAAPAPLAMLAVTILAAGCSGIPFKEAPKVPVDGTDPRAVVDRFASRIPGRFSLLVSLVFDYSMIRRMSALGTVEGDTARDRFTAAVVNQMGVKIMELASTGGKIEQRYLIGALAGKGDVAGAVGADIRRVYFGLLPAPSARVTSRKYRLVFDEKTPAGRERRVFSGPDAALTLKEGYERGDLSWRVYYFEYREIGGKLYPGGVVLDNFKHNYRLIVKLKEVYPDAGN
jgi:hypothetical protein